MWSRWGRQRWLRVPSRREADFGRQTSGLRLQTSAPSSFFSFPPLLCLYGEFFIPLLDCQVWRNHSGRVRLGSARSFIMLKAGDIAIVSGARTPFGRYCGKLKDFTAQELGAVAGKGAIERSGIDPKEFDHVVFGNAQQTSGDALYGARHVGLRAGIPIETPALTVNRLCGSGMQSIVSAAQMIQTDEAKIVLAGGM